MPHSIPLTRVNWRFRSTLMSYADNSGSSSLPVASFPMTSPLGKS